MDVVRLNPAKVKELTVRLALLRGELRDKVGVSGATIARVFSGAPVGVRVARRVAEALGVRMLKILDEGAGAIKVADQAGRVRRKGATTAA